MRVHAQATFVPVIVVGGPSTLQFLNVVAAAPVGTPSVANNGFRADAATGLLPRATVNTAGALTEGTAAQTFQANGLQVLGLNRAVDRTRGHAQATLGGTDANPPVNPVSAISAAGRASASLKVLAAIASAVNTGLLATGADINVAMAFFIGTTGAVAGITTLNATIGGLVHVVVFADDDTTL